MSQTVIVDSGGANLSSLCCALERVGASTLVTRDPHAITTAAHVVLPGVGAAAHAMQRLEAAHLVAVLRGLRQPVLGVCLGMQLLFESSQEGPTQCLAVLPHAIERIPTACGRSVPHMGWNELRPLQTDPLLEGIANGDWAYFVHSYAAPVTENTLASCEYGAPLSAVVRCGNFWGTQFHPERSADTGLRLLENFLRL